MKQPKNNSRDFIRSLALTGGIIALAVALTAGITLGAVRITPSEIYGVLAGTASEDSVQIIKNIRLPRVLSGICVGINLALAGCILQGIFSNPMASPSTIGVSAGAGFMGIAVMILWPQYTFLVPAGAFAGGMLALTMVFFIAWQDGLSPLRLILSGMIVSSFFGALITILFVLFSDKVQGVVIWMAGSLQTQTWSHVYMVLPYTCLGLILSLWACRQLNLLQLGEETAQGLGVNLNQTRFFLLAMAAVLTGSAISVAGLIGFVGLIIPHIARMIVGSDFEYLLPCAALFGASLLIGADTFARFIFSPQELPVGILTALMGAPFFVYLLQKKVQR